tara:strand:- start:4834 stop:5670 length:837 start_codon:yes stop_codon:yes gene_type:complete
MPLFKTHNVWFIHIPKCGGTSIEAAFLNRSDGRSGVFKQAYIGSYTDGWEEEYDLPKGGARQHLTYSELLKIKDIKKFTEKTLQDLTTLSFVRDPWDRFISAIFYLHRHYPYVGAMQKCKNKKEVIRLVKALAWGPDGLFRFDWNWDEFMKYKDHFRTQLCYVEHKGEIAVDFLGRFETFNEDFNKFLIKFGLNKKFYDDKGVEFKHDFSKAPDFVIPKAMPKRGMKKKVGNYSDFKKQFADMGINRYKDLYDDELRSFVYEKYKEDIETFNYSFDDR